MKLLLVFVLFSAFQVSSSQSQSSSSKDVGEVVSLIITSDWLKTIATKVDGCNS
jgi:hypothetical protein